MKKLYISQPMADKSDEDILWERQEALLQVVADCGEDVELIDSFFQNAPHEARPLWFLGKSLELLAGRILFILCLGGKRHGAVELNMSVRCSMG